MKLALLTAFGLALATATTNVQAAPAHAKWMGEATCSAWPRNQAYNDFDKALLLNWVLGWLSRSGKEGTDVLARMDQSSVSGWLDHYCSSHPNDTLISAAALLETELTAKQHYSWL